MAYLARRPDTHLIRLLLLPITLSGIVAAAYRYVWTTPELNVYNWGQCLLAAVTIGKTAEYAYNKEGMLKVGETRPGKTKGKGKATPNGNAVGNGRAHSVPARRGLPYIPDGLYDAIELMHTLRGLQWKFGQEVHIPKPTRPLQRDAFLRATLLSFIQNFLLVDFLESAIKLFPGVGSPLGGSMFYPGLPPLSRYAVSTLIHMLTGSAILCGFGMVYDLVTLIAVSLFDSAPTSWPPVVDDPWSADSMHTLWAKRWHQLLRQTFLVLGGYPGKWLAGDFGMLFGTFIASGLFHECAMYSMGRGFDHTVSLFFTMQGPILVLERMWRKWFLWVFLYILWGEGVDLPPLALELRWILELLQATVHPKLLANVDASDMQQDHHAELITYLDITKILGNGEAAVIDFAVELFKVLGYVHRERVARTRLDILLQICGEVRHAKANVCIFDRPQTDILLLVQTEDMLDPGDAEARLVVAAFDQNNARRERAQLLPMDERVNRFENSVFAWIYMGRR
ncbi:hypothetical protein DXG03_004930 [Asterophora parasitica]|uniref:Wax synthase domain-containing protein n=1 Tax=Asterophora parasitica TaxID=117018 RepID=A0A9P7KFA6_9AGAR|nr:hypothetical protein DXG03_004930 [Asterophora parasitica]